MYTATTYSLIRVRVINSHTRISETRTQIYNKWAHQKNIRWIFVQYQYSILKRCERHCVCVHDETTFYCVISTGNELSQGKLRIKVCVKIIFTDLLIRFPALQNRSIFFRPPCSKTSLVNFPFHCKKFQYYCSAVILCLITLQRSCPSHWECTKSLFLAYKVIKKVWSDTILMSELIWNARHTSFTFLKRTHFITRTNEQGKGKTLRLFKPLHENILWLPQAPTWNHLTIAKLFLCGTPKKWLRKDLPYTAVI